MGLIVRLDGKVAVVTGGASGIGLAMVRVFVDAGGSVVAADVDDAAIASLAGVPGVVAVRTDVSQQVDVDALVSVAMERFGQIDVLCNKRRHHRPVPRRGRVHGRGMGQGLAVNLAGPFLMSRAVLPHMLKAGTGVVINISSAAGLTGANGGAAYTASKHGVIGLSKKIAAMYGPDGIYPIAICPVSPIPGRPRRWPPVASPVCSARSDATRARTHGASLRRADPTEVGRLALFIAAEGAPLLNGGVELVARCCEAKTGGGQDD